MAILKDIVECFVFKGGIFAAGIACIFLNKSHNLHRLMGPISYCITSIGAFGVLADQYLKYRRDRRYEDINESTDDLTQVTDDLTQVTDDSSWTPEESITKSTKEGSSPSTEGSISTADSKTDNGNGIADNISEDSNYESRMIEFDRIRPYLERTLREQTRLTIEYEEFLNFQKRMDSLYEQSKVIGKRITNCERSEKQRERGMEQNVSEREEACDIDQQIVLDSEMGVNVVKHLQSEHIEGYSNKVINRNKIDVNVKHENMQSSESGGVSAVVPIEVELNPVVVPEEAELNAAVVPVEAELNPAIVPVVAELNPAVVPVEVELIPAVFPVETELIPAVVPVETELNPAVVPVEAELNPAMDSVEAELNPAAVPVATELIPAVVPVEDEQNPARIIVEAEQDTDVAPVEAEQDQNEIIIQKNIEQLKIL